MRTKLGSVAIIGAILLGIAASGTALAQHGGHRGYGHAGYGRAGYRHGGVRLYLGVPLYSPWYFPPPYYYPPVVVSSPPVYLERQAPAPQTNYWYYCGESKTYYPYVKDCPGGWQRVAPQPG